MVRQKTWSDIEVSAYLDGELDIATRHTFEAAMAQDHVLRQQVDELREMVSMMRAAPLREPPRNYLLTPGMVSETPAQPEKRRRGPLLLMRLATSAVAAAFVVTTGLGLISQRVNPAMVMQREAAGHMVEMVDTQTAEIAIEEPVALEPKLSEKSAEKELTQEDEAAFAAMPDPGAPMEGMGVGGGGEAEKMEVAPMMVEAAVDPEVESVDSAAEVVTNAVAPEANTPLDEGRTMEDTVETLETAPPEPASIAVDGEEGWAEVPALNRRFPPAWLPVALGVVTLLLAGITVWMSRKR